MTSEEIRTLFDRWADAMVHHDVRSLMATYADDCVVESPLYGTMIGRDAIQRYWESLWGAFDMAYEFDEPMIIGDHCCPVRYRTESVGWR